MNLKCNCQDLWEVESGHDARVPCIINGFKICTWSTFFRFKLWILGRYWSVEKLRFLIQYQCMLQNLSLFVLLGMYLEFESFWYFSLLYKFFKRIWNAKLSKILFDFDWLCVSTVLIDFVRMTEGLFDWLLDWFDYFGLDYCEWVIGNKGSERRWN